MVLFMTTLLLVNYALTQGSDQKCCDARSYLRNVNSTYECTENVNKRYQILTESENFLRNKTDGTCVDTSDGFFEFVVSGGNVTKRLLTTEEYFPKCCPLYFRYNTRFHSCEEEKNMTHEFTKTKFIKVGLSNCKIILDRSGSLNELRLKQRKADDTFCIDKNQEDGFTIRECQENRDVCTKTRCIKKCCPDGQSYVNGARCTDTYTHGFNINFTSRIENPTDDYAIIYNSGCSKVYLYDERKYVFTLDKNGVFMTWENFTSSYKYKDVDDEDTYCIEHGFKKGKLNGFSFFHCLVTKEIDDKYTYTLWAKIASCIFLVLTIVVYVILKETRKIFGKILINYCFATFLEMALLIYSYQHLNPEKHECRVRSFSLAFLAYAAFTWLNVMCFDIWWTFGASRQHVGYQKRRDLKRLLCYLLYGWGLPSCLTLTTYLFWQYEILPKAIHPYLGNFKCFFEDRKGNYGPTVFLHIPLLLFQISNMFFFIRTVMYCLKVKDEINRINEADKRTKKKLFNADKERLAIVIKLAVIMGVSFVFEVVSAFFDMKKKNGTKYVEIVGDTIHCLQGVFIFVIFICKKRIFDEFRKKFNLYNPKSSSASTTESSIHSNSTKMVNINTSKDSKRN